MVGVSTFSPRCWRLPCLGRKPLVRAWDRVETAAPSATVLFVLFAVPFAGLLGSALYDRQRAEVAT